MACGRLVPVDLGVTETKVRPLGCLTPSRLSTLIKKARKPERKSITSKEWGII